MKINDSHPKLSVVKVGGKIVEESESLSSLLDAFSSIEGPKILVHGGGRSATALAERLGVSTTMIEGRRVTDAEMLRIVTMVYAGLVNKTIVADLQSRGVNAIGLTGADLGIIRSHRRPVTAKGIDYGFVGDVDTVDSQALMRLIDNDAVPVIAPLTLGDGTLLNTNADTIASDIARALSDSFEVRLIYCFEKPGVLSDEADETTVIPLITPEIFADLRARGIVTGGMLPKLDNAFQAISSGVAQVLITQASALDDPSLGTTLRP